MNMETISWYLVTFLLNSLWQIPVVACVAVLTACLLRHAPANHRHAVWVVALIASFVLPVVSTSKVTAQRTTSIAFTAPAPPQTLTPVTSQKSTGPTKLSPSPLSRDIAYKQTTATTLALAYLLFLSFCLAKLLFALIRTARVCRGATVKIQSAVIQSVWTRCARSFGLSDVQLLTSARILTPAAAGFWRKVIVLPDSLLRSANEEELTTAIGHEMAHLARHDFALNIIYPVALSSCIFPSRFLAHLAEH